MKIQFLGTAAAEGYPCPFCRCDNCTAAREIGGRAIRKRASILIDDIFLIDFGPDLITASQIHGAPMLDLAYAAQTHGHDDHYFPDNFIYRTDRCQVTGVPRLQYAVSPLMARRIKEFAAVSFRSEDDLGANRFPSFNMDLVTHDDWATVQLGPYEVLAIPAAHAPGMQARILAIRHADGPAFLYGTDTAPLPITTWERVALEGWRFDLLILDHTHGTASHSATHHSSESMLREVAIMRDAGIACEKTRVIAHHFAHHSNPLPDEFDRFAAERGYEPAWDGMVVKF